MYTYCYQYLNQNRFYMKLLEILLVFFILAQLLASPVSVDQHTFTFLPSFSRLLQNSKNNNNDSCTQDCCASLPSRPPMTYYYYQNTGRFRGGSSEYAIDALGYSGQKQGLNNPSMECVVNTGPLPATTYKLASCVNYMHQTTQRPCSFPLVPQNLNQMCGRSDFMVHGCACCKPGDNKNPPTAGCSSGCIILSYENRKKLRVGDSLIVEHFEPTAQMLVKA